MKGMRWFLTVGDEATAFWNVRVCHYDTHPCAHCSMSGGNNDAE